MSLIKVPQERLNLLWTLVLIGSGIIALRLVDIQLLRHQYYKDVADKNRTQIIYQTAPRGTIFTRDNVPIAKNLPSFSLIFFPGKFSDTSSLDDLARDFAPILNVTESELRERIQHSFERGRPIRLAENLSEKSMFMFSELKTLYPGVDILVETKRYYPNGNFASHFIGYLGRMNAKEWAEVRQKRLDYRMEARVGKSGLEKMFEPYLKGKDGGIYLEIDWKGRVKRVLDNIPWRAGDDIYTTIDSEAQKAAEDGLKASLTNKGAVVAINPQNGDVLAMASAPDFDPNMFVAYSDSAPVKATRVPEYNLALQGLFAPASTFKIIVSLAALESGKVKPTDKFFCPGYYDAGNRVFKCWQKKGHGPEDLFSGLANSCDVYYYSVGARIGAEIIEKFERLMGLGSPTGILMPGEKSGHLFGPVTRGKSKWQWFLGDTLNMSIGQGELLVTPIQMAQVIAAVANGGNFWRPQYILRIEDRQDHVLLQKKTELLRSVKLQPETWQIMRQALKGVVDGGTGSMARINGLNVYGKTGTDQNPHGDSNAWFVAYAEKPGEKPEIAVAVLVQFGLHGSSAAAPIAKRVIEAYYRLNKPAPVKVSTATVTAQPPAAPAARQPAGVPAKARPAAPPAEDDEEDGGEF